MLRYLLSFALLLPGALAAQTHNALDFDAVDDRVDCGTDASVDITGTNISIEAWIKPTSWGPNFFSGNIVNKEDAAWAGYMIRCGASAQLNFAIGNGIDWYETTSSANALTLNTWQHVAGTYDGSFVRLYVNGIQVTSMAYSIPIAHADNPLALGDWSVNSDHRYYHGLMDEVRVWNITLDQPTIAANYHTSFCDPQPGLVAYYKFDQGVGGGDNTSITALIDETGSNTGTLSGFGLTGNTSNFLGGTPLGTQVNETLCPDETYLFDGQELSEPGVYTATFPVSGSCDSIVVLTLTDIPVNVNVAQNGNLLLSTANGAQYQWINCTTEQPIAGATGQYYTATAVGEYAVIVTQNNCSDTSACYSVTTIGIEEIERPTMRVWPQPARDMLNVELSHPVSNVELRILDMTGRLVESRSLAVLQRTAIDMSALSTGVYFVDLRSRDGSSSMRFVRE